jgi:TonB-linked SusC/RagA family outer membrane protein
MSRAAHWAAIALVALPGSAVLAQQTTGTVTGRVTDAATGQPVPAAQVSIVGTNIGSVSNDQGQYTIRGAPARAVTVRVLRVGYSEQTQPVTVTAGAPVALNFTLRQVSVNLAAVVTTATGQERRVEVGNAVSTVDAARVVEQSPVANINDLLNSRAPGVQLQTSGATGAGARVRIRGTNSLSLSNDPVYIVDGVRIEASSNNGGIASGRAQGIGVGGTQTSRLNDINPEEIENIEVIKGPSAATLYGTDAANGVIVITTKKGRAGPAQWNFYTEQGGIRYLQDFPTNYAAFGNNIATDANGTVTRTPTNACFLTSIAAGTCARDSLTTLNILEDDDLTIFGTGYRKQYGLQLGGGSEAVRYFVAGEFEGERNPLKLPEFERSRLSGLGRPIAQTVDDPNGLEKKSVRLNLNASPTSKLDFGLQSSYVDSDQRLPNLDNNLLSPFAQALYGFGYRTTTQTTTGATLNGYRNFTPADIYEESYTQAINRVITAGNANWRPLGWLSSRANVGVDYIGRRETDICRFQTCPDNGTTRQGYSIDDRSEIFQYTGDVNATASFQPLTSLGTKTTFGGQYVRNLYTRARTNGTILPPGGVTPAAGSVQTVQAQNDETRTLGFFAQQDIAWRERLFANVAVRYDDNSAFGADFSGVFYPKASVSYLISEEGFFPKPGWLDQLRLRSAVGESGVRPGTNDAQQFLSAGREATLRLAAAELPGLTLNSPGNPNLKPETTREFEAGIEGTFLGNRLSTEFTYYNKESRGALIARVLPPSLGAGAQTRFENLGSVTNKGIEALINAQLVQRRAVGWDVTVSGSSNSNKLVDLGGVPPQILATVQQRAGYPLNGYWQRPYTFADANGNSIIEASEVTVADSAQFIGYSIPRYEVTFTNGLDLFNRRFRIQALVDYKGGHYLYNNTERFKCGDAANCRARFDPTAPLAEQARSVAGFVVPSAQRTLVGYMEKADFVRFRELSATFTAPDLWASRLLRARGLSATLAARNLALFTDYSGMDPESSYGQGDIPQDFLTVPPPSYLSFRLNVRF